MKLGRIIAAAATSGLLLSGAFVVAEEYTGHNVFAVNLDNSNKIELKTKKGTVREILIANDIPFGADDRVEPGLDTKVNGGETISIYKAHEVTIVDGDTTTVRKTTYKKVGDILKELNITLGEKDQVTPGLNSEVATVDTIKIARTGKTIETKKEVIKFETKEEKDDSKYVDEKVTKVEGKDGEKEVTYNVVRENGKEVSREVASEKVITEATAKVVVVGTKQRPAAEQAYAAPAQSYSAPGGSVVLPNGNTAGADGAAAAQEMSIASSHDMDIVYDDKIYTPGAATRLTNSYLSMIGRMDSRDRADYDCFYDSITTDFKQRNLSGRELAEFKYQRFMRDYAKVTKSLDDNVGRVLDELKRLNLLDSTLVVYTSDQGFYMGEHGWFDKRFMYEESLNTPLVMRLPAGFKGRGEIKEMVQNIDYAPTFLDLAGAPIPADMDGVSLLPLLKGQHPKNWRKSIYYHFYEYPAEHSVKRHYGVRTDRWKLIHFYNDIDEWELFDLKNDPHELNNIYGQPGTEKITKELRKELHRLQAQYRDPIESQLK